jgi:hypothetical protein
MRGLSTAWRPHRTAESGLKIKSQRDFWSGLMFLVLGVAFALGSTRYAMGSPARPGPGYFPLLLSLLMAMLGAIVLFKSLVIEAEDGDPIGPIAWRPLLAIVASIGAFGLLIDRLGIVLSIPALILIASLASDDFRWRGVLLSAVALTLASWLIFVWGLQAAIPVWPAFAR